MRQQLYCHTIQCEIKRPCQLKECPYNVNSPYTKNCLLPYPDDTHLSLAEVSYLFNKPLKALRRIYASATEKVYTSYFKHAFKDDLPVYYLASNRFSIASESYVIRPVRIANRYVIDQSEIKYSTKVWEKAVALSVTPERLLKTSLKLFKNNRLMDSYFDLPKGMTKRLRAEFI